MGALEMIYSIWTDKADAIAAESLAWINHMRWMMPLRTKGSDEILDVIEQTPVALSLLTDPELDDRDRFPILGYKAGKLNKTGGFTKRWAEPEEVTEPSSPYYGQWAIPKPTATHLEPF